MYASDYQPLCSTVPSPSPTCTWVHVALSDTFDSMTALSFLYFCLFRPSFRNFHSDTNCELN